MKMRPQSSNQYSSRRKNLASAKGSSASRVWKYNQSNGEMVPGVAALTASGHSGFGMRATGNQNSNGSVPQTAMNKTSNQFLTT